MAFERMIDGIWERRVLTNGGPLHQQLEAELTAYLGVDHLSLFTNATVALITALQALEIRGEVITTPYSFVATGHAILWNRLIPVFCDIDAHTLNIDPSKLDRLITAKTTAILPVHCYGHPCDTSAIQGVAERHGLKVIYDAAHAFGIEDRGGSVLRHGDLSILSFHATKVFNTFEGGAIVSPSAAMKARIDKLKNFGFEDEVTVTETGINGKMSELHAAVGLCQLPLVEGNRLRRSWVASEYRKRLGTLVGLQCVPPTSEVLENHSYFPILIDPAFGASRDTVYTDLKSRQIFARRYFYPLISEFPMYRGLRGSSSTHLPVAHDASQRILCLPMSAEMSDAEVVHVCDSIQDIQLAHRS